MPRLIVTEGATIGLKRCRDYLAGRDATATKRAGRIIAERLSMLERNAAIGRPFDDDLGLREVVIPFGDAGYVAIYRYDASQDVIYLLAFRHQREAGYETIQD